MHSCALCLHTIPLAVPEAAQSNTVMHPAATRQRGQVTGNPQASRAFRSSNAAARDSSAAQLGKQLQLGGPSHEPSLLAAGAQPLPPLESTWAAPGSPLLAALVPTQPLLAALALAEAFWRGQETLRPQLLRLSSSSIGSHATDASARRLAQESARWPSGSRHSLTS